MVELLDDEVTTAEVRAWRGLHLLHWHTSSCSQKTRIVLALKHGDRLDLVPAAAEWMCRAGVGIFESDTLLVPVPAHWTRLFTRRYNQSALLAQGLGRASDRPVAMTALRRTRRTPPQVRLSAAARHRNVTGAFAVRPDKANAVEGRRLLLVDDVLTTGATLSACAKALRRVGAAGVDALVLARVVPGR